MLKRTALFEEHLKLKGRMVDFGGWELPVQYSGLSLEHNAVRTACGLFDVSHMGEVFVEGPGALEFVNALTTNDASVLAEGQAQYTAMLDHHTAGIVDDLVIYKYNDEKILLVVNASNTDKDFSHIEHALKHYPGSKKPKITNCSKDFSQIALQGPLAEKILSSLTKVNLKDIKTYWFKEGVVAGIPTIIARTGYTGEDGFELYMPWSDGPRVWSALIEAGSPHGLLPCGLGARDTLRLEMKYSLYGHELTDETNPLEVGLAWITKLNKKSDFVGKETLIKIKEAGIKRALVGVKSLGRGIPRQSYEVWNTEKDSRIGTITSGTQSPSLKQAIGIALVEKKYEPIGTKFLVKVREDFHEFEVVKTPFYQKEKP